MHVASYYILMFGAQYDSQLRQALQGSIAKVVKDTKNAINQHFDVPEDQADVDYVPTDDSEAESQSDSTDDERQRTRGREGLTVPRTDQALAQEAEAQPLERAQRKLRPPPARSTQTLADLEAERIEREVRGQEMMRKRNAVREQHKHDLVRQAETSGLGLGDDDDD